MLGLKKNLQLDFANLAKKSVFSWLIFLLPMIFFAWYKFSHLALRFGDGNAYFYMADQILHGAKPYLDFPLADPPLLVYLLAGVKFLIGDHLILFQAVPIICELLTVLVLFLKLKKAHNHFAPLVSFIHLFSFLILSTSDYVTGLHWVILFLSLAWYFEDQPLMSGIFWALASLIKLYTAPALLAYCLYLVLKKDWQKLAKFLLGFIATGLLVMLPFLLTAFKEVFNFTLLHQLARPKGLDKLTIIKFFIEKDFLLLMLLVWSAINTVKKKDYRLVLPIIALLIFFLSFADLYYLYLGVFSPFFSLLLLENLASFWQQSKSWQKQVLVSVAVFYLLVTVPRFLNYMQVFHDQGKFVQLVEVVNYVNNHLTKNYKFYGSHEVAPLVALASHKELFGELIDTNTQLFASGALDKQAVSQQAAEQGIYLFTKVANLSYNAKPDTGYEGYFAEEVFVKTCHQLTIINGNDQEIFDDVAIYECKL